MVAQRDFTALGDVLKSLKSQWQALFPLSLVGFLKEKEVIILKDKQESGIIDYYKLCFTEEYILNSIKIRLDTFILQ